MRGEGNSDDIKAPSLEWSTLEREETQDEEIAWAKSHCRVTRIFGWFLILSFILGILACYLSDYKVKLEIVTLVGAFYILQGSQAWIRAFLLLVGFSFLIGLVKLVWRIFNKEPIDTMNGVYYFDQIGLLKAASYPVMMTIICFVISLAVLKARKLRFWSKPTRFWGKVILVVWFVVASFKLVGRHSASTKSEEVSAKNREVIQLVEDYVSRFGVTSIGSIPHKRLEEALKQAGREGPIYCEHYPGDGRAHMIPVFHQGSYSYGGSDDFDYRKTIRFKRGEWMIVLIDLE